MSTDSAASAARKQDERRWFLRGRNFDRPHLVINETVWAESYDQAIHRADLAREWLNKVPAHVWEGSLGAQPVASTAPGGGSSR